MELEPLGDPAPVRVVAETRKGQIAWREPK